MEIYWVDVDGDRMVVICKRIDVENQHSLFFQRPVEGIAVGDVNTESAAAPAWQTSARLRLCIAMRRLR